MPVITLEVMTASSEHENDDDETVAEEQTHVHDDTIDNAPGDTQSTGVHFLSESEGDVKSIIEEKEESKPKSELLEYMMRHNGTVICKLCGEVLRSRTHWYRHKYKNHVVQSGGSLNPAPLFQCEHCLVFFKSKKGYIGHVASRHSESDSSPALPTTEEVSKENPPDIKEELDIEMSIPASSVANCQTTTVRTATKSTETKRISRGIKESNSKDWEERRSREEKLVADIIDRVRRECEAQGSGGATRRGYTRRTTVMHT